MSRAARKDKGSIKCPKCEEPMSAGSPAIPACSGCGGVWIKSARFRSKRDGTRSSSDLIDVLEDGSEATDVCCPDCRDRTLRVSEYRGIDLDWCAGCGGLYFDKGELADSGLLRPNSQRGKKAADEPWLLWMLVEAVAGLLI